MIVSFLRHASTEWNEQGLMQGRRDIPLSASGRNEIAGWKLPRSLAGPIEWLSSPLSRAAETAQRLGGASPRLVSALTEMDWGAWEGHRLAELRGRFGREFAHNEKLGLDFRPPRGESPRDVVARLSEWLHSIPASNHALVAVTHNGVLRALLALATGWDMTGKPPFKLQRASLHQFLLEPGPKLTVFACNVPLAAEEAPVDRVREAVPYPAVP
jgi:2,3-bisphosphoglycerate-dependent phosphoglycerate mutase